MTYIIAEPCIDIKDLSCVDVCPVDCIHEFERILIIDPEECIDCFAPDEQLLTTYGPRTFAELENQPCRVLTDGGFKPALVKRFRRKPLVKLELAPAFEERDRYGGRRLTTRNVSRFRRTIWATPTHSWLLADGDRTDSLSRRRLRPRDAAPAEARERELPTWCPARPRLRGRRPGTSRRSRRASICTTSSSYGDKVARFRDFFDQVNFSAWPRRASRATWAPAS